MSILLRNAELDSRLDRLVQGQSVRTTRTHLAEAMIEAGCAACEQTGNPEAWREIGNPASASIASAQQNGTGRSVDSVNSQITQPASVQSKPAPTGDSALTA